MVTLAWGFNWAVLKIGVSEMPPLTFRALTLPFAGLGLLLIAKLSGESVRIPRLLWGRLTILALFNISAWNGLTLFGVHALPAGRSVILAYTMPLFSVLLSVFMLHEPLSGRRLTGVLLGMLGMTLLLGEDIGLLGRSLTGTLLILVAALSWAFGTVLLRRWKPPLPQNTLTGWMVLLGWLPIAVLAPAFDPRPWTEVIGTLSSVAWFALLYNILAAGVLAHWAWFTMARTLPVAVSSLSSLPVPVVGVLSGMIVLGERPGWTEYVALALVVAALAAVLFVPGKAKA